jgi:hypothetical protein
MDEFTGCGVHAEKLIDVAKQRADSARTEYELAQGAYCHALCKAVWEWCIISGIYPPCKVEMDFQEGKEVVFFEGIHWEGDEPIIVRHLTKRGKPHKYATRYEWHYIKQMRRIASEAT